MLLIRRVLLMALVAGLLLAAGAPARSVENSALPLAEVLRTPTLRTEVTSNGREQVRLVLTNRSSAEALVAVPAGSVFLSGTGKRVITLRFAEFKIPADGSTEVEIPAAALSSKNDPGIQEFSLAEVSEPKLSELLKFLATRDDIPRTTSQLMVLALLENVTFAQWRQFIAGEGDSDGDKANPVIQAIDALGLLKESIPEGNFALAEDNELKLRALRHPATRAKAVQIYGLAVSGAPGEGLPSLKQLLHTQPGDNCPTCRMRERASRGAGDL